jgi:hypothetical protein
MESHIATVIPLLNRYGLRATFLVSPNADRYRMHRNFWEREFPAMGHRLGNHTMHHRGAKNLEEADYEIGEAARIIWSIYPKETKLLVFASGGGRKLWGGKEWEEADPAYRQLTERYQLIDLYDGNHPYLSARGSMKTEDLCDELDRTILKGGQRTFTFHDIGPLTLWRRLLMLLRGADLSVREQVFTDFLQCLVSRKERLWIAPLIEQIKYVKEAQHAKVRLISMNRKSATWELTVGTDPMLYDHPITLILPNKQGRSIRSINQGNISCTVYRDGAGAVVADVRPENSKITVTYGGM